MQPDRLSILGVGLLGGSIGLAVRDRLTNCQIIGYGHRLATLDRAQQMGAIDRGTTELGSAVTAADLVILCTPVGLFEEVLTGISPFLKPGVIVTDVGSTKASVVAQAHEILPKTAHFVASHPMAGSEKRGVEFARADLYQNALCIMTPTADTDEAALGAVEAFWRLLGMRTCRMSPADHDRTLAEVSHLPHAVAAALVAMQTPDAVRMAGKGFLDTTRIAGGDGGLWRDIFVDNAGNVRAALANLRATLDEFEGLLDPARSEDLRKWLDQVAARREAMLKEKDREGAGE
jgi:prephenate dehydrogenase